MNIIKKIFKIFYFLIIACLIVVAVFLFLSAIPKIPVRSFVVLSGSMEPAIHTGSVVAVKAQGEYNVGDVITFGENGKTKTPTTHRIVEIKENDGDKSFITKGDANNAPDQKSVKENEVLGKVLFSVPYAGYVVNAAQKPIGFVLIIIVPAVIVIYDEILKIKKEIKKKMDYKKRVKERKNNKKSEESKESEKDSDD